jgi:hypothetical protein
MSLFEDETLGNIAIYYALHVAGREGRPHSGALLPVSEFGLRVSGYTSGDVFNIHWIRSR